MPNTAKGTPYVISTDLVADYPTTSSALATHIDDKLAYNAVTINAQTGTTYTFALADASAGKLVTATNAGSQTYTVPPQSSVTWADGAILRILNQGAGVVTVAGGVGVTINGTPLTLPQYSGAALQRTASNTWTMLPFSGGAGNADFSDTPTGTYTSGGVNYKYISFLASSTINITRAGLVDVLMVGGGGGGHVGGAGAGGYFEASNYYLPVANHTVTVGAGGALGAPGNKSTVYTLTAAGGGNPTYNATANASIPAQGGSGSGAYVITGLTGKGIQGNDGGASNAGTGAGSGGGGAGAVGGSVTVNANGAAGGAGSASAITGSSVTRAGGGGGWGSTAAGAGGAGGGGAGALGAAAPTAGTANTGGGGGGGSTPLGAAGGSGLIVIRVRTN